MKQVGREKPVVMDTSRCCVPVPVHLSCRFDTSPPGGRCVVQLGLMANLEDEPSRCGNRIESD